MPKVIIGVESRETRGKGPMVQPCRCRICDAFVYIDEGPEGVCPQCARLLEEMREIAQDAEADSRN